MTADGFIHEVLLPACNKIDGNYFLVERADCEPVYRERVYAYELYHQMRLQLEKVKAFSDLVLHGELDKSGAVGFRKEKPDILLHDPGTKNNFAVIEIKSARANVGEINSDVRKLDRFTRAHLYHIGILIVFGEGRDGKSVEVSCVDGVKVVCHARLRGAFLSSNGICAATEQKKDLREDG